MMKNEMTSAPNPVDYFVGDLCYVLHDAWNEVCDLVPFDNSQHEFELADGRKFVLFNTAYGDGEYLDQNGNRYPVDAGVIGAIKLSDIRDPDPYLEGGKLHTFPAEIDGMDCFYEDGTIHIYKVVIETGDDYEEDEVDVEGEDEYEDA